MQMACVSKCGVVCAVGLCGFLCVLIFSFLYCELVWSNSWVYVAPFLGCRWGDVRLCGAVMCYNNGPPSFPFSFPRGWGYGCYVVCCGLVVLMCGVVKSLFVLGL